MNKTRYTRIWCIIVMLSMVLCAQGVAWGDNILLPIQNPSFEADMLSADGWNSSITGWTVAGYGGTWYPYPAENYFNEALPDGNKIAWLSSGSISQTLTDVLLPNTGYFLKVDVGSRTDYQPYTVALYAGDYLLASYSSVVPDFGFWQEVDVPFMSTSDTPGIGLPLKIVLNIDNKIADGSTCFDNVRLEDAAVPVPPTVLLLGSGLLGLGLLGRQRKKG